MVGREACRALRPGEDQEIRVGYQVTDALYSRRHELFEQLAKARALIDGSLVAEVARPIQELQDF
jgi:hypothetical protein